MDLGLQGKKALVMSSSRGLGEGIARALADEGVQVLINYIYLHRNLASADMSEGALGFVGYYCPASKPCLG